MVKNHRDHCIAAASADAAEEEEENKHFFLFLKIERIQLNLPRRQINLKSFEIVIPSRHRADL